jgi:hypothetical protein
VQRHCERQPSGPSGAPCCQGAPLNTLSFGSLEIRMGPKGGGMNWTLQGRRPTHARRASAVLAVARIVAAVRTQHGGHSLRIVLFVPWKRLLSTSGVGTVRPRACLAEARPGDDQRPGARCMQSNPLPCYQRMRGCHVGCGVNSDALGGHH